MSTENKLGGRGICDNCGQWHNNVSYHRVFCNATGSPNPNPPPPGAIGSPMPSEMRTEIAKIIWGTVETRFDEMPAELRAAILAPIDRIMPLIAAHVAAATAEITAREAKRNAMREALRVAELEAQLEEMTARAFSLALHLPPETLVGDVREWRDEAKEKLARLAKAEQQLAEAKEGPGTLLFSQRQLPIEIGKRKAAESALASAEVDRRRIEERNAHLVGLLKRASRNVAHSARHIEGAKSRELLAEIDAAIQAPPTTEPTGGRG